MVFDVKIGDLTRKARFCANGNETDPPKDSTFSMVVSRDTVRLFFLMAALHDTDVLSADIQNAYLNAPVKEKATVHDCRKRIRTQERGAACNDCKGALWVAE